jgi:hypothetical protein
VEERGASQLAGRVTSLTELAASWHWSSNSLECRDFEGAGTLLSWDSQHLSMARHSRKPTALKIVYHSPLASFEEGIRVQGGFECLLEKLQKFSGGVDLVSVLRTGSTPQSISDF